MSWRRRAVGLLVGLWALTAGTAGAQTFNYFNTCGFDGPLYMGCASAQAIWTGNDLVLRIWNMQGYGTPDDPALYGQAHTITAIGLAYLGLNSANDGVPDPTVGSWSVFYGTTDVSSFWKLGANPLQLELGSETDQGHKGGIVGCTDPGPPSAQHVSTCDNYPDVPYVQFSFNDIANLQSLEDYHYEFHSQQTGGPEGSLKGSAPPTEPPPTDVVPEPVTSVLFGTGLLAMGLARHRRRRPVAEPDAAAG